MSVDLLYLNSGFDIDAKFLYLPLNPYPVKKIFTLLAMLPLFVSAQRNCGSMEHLNWIMLNDPAVQQKMSLIEQQTNEFAAHAENGERQMVTIPVVVHVLYKTSTSNISDAQIQSQIQVLNNDFRKLNSDVVNTPSIFTASDPNIQFCLASVDPSGNATTGITRTATAVTSFSTNDAMKYSAQGGKDAWPSSQYLNIWVCTLSNSILGYAQFPGGAAATDGVVIDYRYFGTTGTATAPFNLGRTATHEVGHWLNLRHIWGDANCGSDLVSDTPTHNTSNYGCPAYPHLSTCSGSPVEMTMNYMDYTDDACMYMFSEGQTVRMQSLFVAGGARASLLTSNGCGIPTPVVCGTVAGLSASGIAQTAASLSWTALAGATSYVLNYKPTAGTTWTTVNVTTNSYALTGLTAGTAYTYTVAAVCAEGTSNASTASFTTTAVVVSCTDNYESNNSLSKAKAIAKNVDITARISTSTDKDYFSFSTTSTDKNIKIELKNLPADYDVKLYKGSTLVATSANSGTANETIIYNTTTTGSYKVYVYGYNGAFNATLCYTLRAGTSSVNFREMEEAPVENEVTVPVGLSIQQVFPNPTQNKIQVQFTHVEEEMIQVELYDLMGKMIFTQQWLANTGSNGLSIDLSDVAAGHYVLALRTANAVDTQLIQKD